MRTTIMLAATVLLATAQGAPAQLADKKVLTLAAAQKIADAAHTLAVTNKYKQCIVVLDDGGNLVVFYRMDDAQLAGFQVAMAKAKTALMFQTPSKAFADRVLAGQTNVLGLPGAAPIDGGVPLMHDGKIVGVIGVSGASPTQDGQTATAAAATLE